jgi:flagellar motor switch protein FliN
MKAEKIMDAKVKLDVVIGSKKYPVKDLAKIGEGTIIELDSLAGEPVELRASNELIGYGEVVVIDENFGIRVTEVLSKE